MAWSPTLGLVSNTLAAEGIAVSTLCRMAQDAGFGYVELRQRSLGSLEATVTDDDRPWPLPEACASLRADFPGLGLNLAVEAPFLSRGLEPDDPYLSRCAEAALALSSTNPFVRLVDTAPRSIDAADPEFRVLAERLRATTVSLQSRGVRLVLENCHQSMATMVALAEHSGSDSFPRVRLCWDPHNQSRAAPNEDPIRTASAEPGSRWEMIHFKQGPPNAVSPEVHPGELDWSGILAALRNQGFCGPALFELPPGPQPWERLARSRDFILSLAPLAS